MKIVVLSTHAQLDFFTRHHNASAFKVYCDNTALFPRLEKEKIPYQKVDDFLIEKEKWSMCNSWGCQTAALWIKSTRDKRFGHIDWPQHLFFRLSYFLIGTLKNYLFAEALLKTRPSGILNLSSVTRSPFVQTDGNVELKYFLEALGLKQGIKVQTQYLKENVTSTPPKERIRILIQKIYSKIFGQLPITDVLAFGSLAHLSSTLKALKIKKTKIVLYDDAFHWEQLIFALKNDLPYVIHPLAGQSDEAFRKGARHEFWGSLPLLLQTLVFEGRDLSPFVKGHIDASFETYLKTCSMQSRFYKRLLKKSLFKSVLLDEDMTAKRSFLASFAVSQGIRVNCISHANLAVNLSVDDDHRLYQQSTMYVQSEFERDMYARRGWNPEGIQVTGTPRYDRLFHMKKEIRRPASEKLKLFYCAASMRDYTPDSPGYLGIHMTCYGVWQIPALHLIMDGIKDIPAMLVAKPHAMEGRRWNNFFNSQYPSRGVKVKRHSDDFYKILLDCDVMLVAHWSTAVIEGAICGIPLIIIDQKRCLDTSFMRQFSSCTIVGTADELRTAVEKLRNEKIDRSSIDLNKDREYYLGKSDGLATERTSNYINKLCQPKTISSDKSALTQTPQ
jgi:hypothetical protein